MADAAAGPISVLALLMLGDGRSGHELGEVLWAAFKEVEAFYNADRLRAKLRRVSMSPYVADSIRQESVSDPSQRLLSSVYMKTVWRDTRGRNSRTVELSKVRDVVRSLAGLDGDTRHVIVIDRNTRGSSCTTAKISCASNTPSVAS